MKKNLLIILFFIISTWSSGYVLTKNNFGQTVKWGQENMKLSLYSSLGGVSQQIFSDAVAQWNSNSKLVLQIKGPKSDNYNDWSGNGYNDIGYSKQSDYFNNSCAVLGVTTLVYDNDGNITEADILLNGYSECFSINTNNDNFLGNVITHELGHLVGLAHNEVMHSSMYYAASIGQYILSSDEKAGAHTLYPSSSKGGIQGKIIGGNSLVGIFGVNVMLISIKNGKVLAASLSDPDGTFSITGVDIKKDDRYYIYVSPVKNKDVLPSYYYSIRNNFCHSNASYRGAFFQSCGNSLVGYPYGLKATVDNQILESGNITIRCNIDVPDDYFYEKNEDFHELDIIGDGNNIGETFVGYFDKKYNYESDALSSIELEGIDRIKINLSNFNFTDWGEVDETIYLEYRIISQDIYSKLISKVKINGIEQNYIFSDSDYSIIYNQKGRVPISKTNFESNVFEFTIEPLNKWGKCSDSLVLDISQMCPINGYQENQLFYMDDGMYDPLFIYLLDFHVSKKKNTLPDKIDNYAIIAHKIFDINQGNDSCSDAPNAYQVSAYIPEFFSGLIGKKKSDNDPMACGSIDTSSPGGPFNNFISMLLGFLLVLIFFRQKRVQNY